MSPEIFGGDIDSSAEAGVQSPEQAEKLNEAYKEKAKASQKASKQLKKDEAKAKVFDDGLGDVIKKFLNDRDKDFIVSLVTGLIEKNVPSDFILAILVPISDLANEKIAMKISEKGIQNLGLSVQIENKFHQQIFDWINVIYSVAILEKEGVLETVIDHNSWKPIPGLDKLFLEILKTLTENGEIGDFERAISYKIFEKVIEKLENEIE
ncbi:hypothetical protein LR002_02800 [Candidatus Gracilibacteria bacterium]|nr:hypothetical protein [Candidatus Gracilibacteria bacterium]